MKDKKRFLFVVSSLLMTATLVACGNIGQISSSSVPPRPLEIGDIVKEWTYRGDLDSLPMDVAKSTALGDGSGEIITDYGRQDKTSLLFNVTVGSNQEGYIGTDVISTPYFLEEDAKNGDILSLYFYVPADSNVYSLQLVAYTSSMNNPINGDAVLITDDDVILGLEQPLLLIP